MIQYQKDVIAVVDSASAGQYYVPLFVGRGYRCIHIDVYCSKASFPSGAFNELFFKTIKVEHENDLSRVIEELKKFSVKAILVGAESGVEVADALAHHFHVYKNDFKTVQNRCNKFYMNEALKNAGIPCVKQVKSTIVEDHYSMV